MKRIAFALLIITLLLVMPGSALAQTYRFSLDQEIINVYWNEDGNLAVDYQMTFTNDLDASAIDYVDIGVPNTNYEFSNVRGDVAGTPITDISSSQYTHGPGIAFGLGNNSIAPGEQGTVHAYIGGIYGVLYTDSEDDKYASAKFSPSWFGSEYVHGNTDLTVIFHLPPGVKPEEPKYHVPENWPGANEPQTGLDKDERIIYTWQSNAANGSTQYTFGASFPKSYVPEGAIVTQPGILEDFSGIFAGLFSGDSTCCCIAIFMVVFLGIPIFGAINSRKRKLQYLPPKVAIEGHGIKRGLTAVETAILMEQPMNKVMTMILFSIIKKGAAIVKTKEPLELEITQPAPEGLQPYETDFLEAFKAPPAGRKKLMQDTIINLIKNLTEKMKGFSRKETIDYYQSIMQKAWNQVETAGTPEVKSQLFEENLEWTMLDRNFNDHTRDVFQGGPVFVPIWWGHFDPTFSTHAGGSLAGAGTSAAASLPSAGGLSMPTLPGADFAASMVKGVEGFASSVVGDVTAFTSGITNKTNPAPVSSSRGWSGGGGGGGCACACACAGCACACAGGGR